MGYHIQLVIKVDDLDPKRPIVLSFHESNKDGKFMQGNKDFSDKLCAVIVDNVKQFGERDYRVGYTVQRGFIVAYIDSVTKYYSKDIALVDYQDIVYIYIC